MTSTEFTCGLEGTRVSSKVLKPPGGGSSDIFGLGSSQFSNGTNERQKNKDAATKSRVFGESNDLNTTPSRCRRDDSKSNIFGSEFPAVPKSVKKAYVRRNPITGEEFTVEPEIQLKIENGGSKDEENNIQMNEPDEPEDEKVEEKAVPLEPKPIQTSIRVRAPPGGKSSGIF